jgi:hypothetical protein
VSALGYKGRAPDSDYSVLHKKWVDDRYAAQKVDNTYINAQVAAKIAAAGLVDQLYVDQQDATLAHKAAVDSADYNYLPASQLGTAGGVAQLGADIYVPAANLPPLQTERAPYFKNADSIFLTGTRDVSQVNPKEFEAARLTIPDLGFSYTPLLFAVIQGGAINAPNPLGRAMGTGNYAQISVLHTDNSRRALTITSGQKAFDFFVCMPSADVATPLAGANTFGLWLGMQTGTTYSFKAEGLRFWAMCFPAL